MWYFLFFHASLYALFQLKYAHSHKPLQIPERSLKTDKKQLFDHLLCGFTSPGVTPPQISSHTSEPSSIASGATVKKSAMDRKAELEKKKQKLAALRADKEKRRREKEAKDAEDATGRVVSGQDNDKHRDLDQMLQDLGVPPISEVVMSSISSANSGSSDHSANATPDGSLQTISPNGQV